MPPIVLKLFVNNAAELAQVPGRAMKSVSLTHQRGPNPATPGPNDHLFDSAGAGNVILSLGGVTDEVKSQFKGGKIVKVTIEDDDGSPEVGCLATQAPA